LIQIPGNSDLSEPEMMGANPGKRHPPQADDIGRPADLSFNASVPSDTRGVRHGSVRYWAEEERALAKTSSARDALGDQFLLERVARAVSKD
jgi:hypothetical protein